MNYAQINTKYLSIPNHKNELWNYKTVNLNHELKMHHNNLRVDKSLEPIDLSLEVYLNMLAQMVSLLQFDFV